MCSVHAPDHLRAGQLNQMIANAEQLQREQAKRERVVWLQEQLEIKCLSIKDQIIDKNYFDQRCHSRGWRGNSIVVSRHRRQAKARLKNVFKTVQFARQAIE